MTADNFTPTRDWLNDAISMSEEVENPAWGIPTNCSTPGYRPLPQTEIECRRLLQLLERRASSSGDALNANPSGTGTTA